MKKEKAREIIILGEKWKSGDNLRVPADGAIVSWRPAGLQRTSHAKYVTRLFIGSIIQPPVGFLLSIGAGHLLNTTTIIKLLIFRCMKCS